MTPDNFHLVKHHLERAGDTLKESRTLLEQGLVRGAVNRSYYAMFYAANALLATKYLAFKKHSAVIAAFEKEFVKSGKLPSELGDWLREAFKTRGASDYTAFVDVEKTKAQELLKNAQAFVAKVHEVVKKELK